MKLKDKIFLSLLILVLNLDMILNSKMKFKMNNPNEFDIKKVIPVKFDAPEKPGEKESVGVMTVIDVLDHNENIYKPYRFLIDSLSSVFWLVSEACETSICSVHKKYLPLYKTDGVASIELNNGKLHGSIYSTSVKLGSYQIHDQPIFLVDDVAIPEFEVI
jgi:hypothetical protein